MHSTWLSYDKKQSHRPDNVVFLICYAAQYPKVLAQALSVVSSESTILNEQDIKKIEDKFNSYFYSLKESPSIYYVADILKISKILNLKIYKSQLSRIYNESQKLYLKKETGVSI